MSKKVQSIYEYLKDYSKEEIDSAIGQLSEEDRKLLFLRYGGDLINPKKDDNWSKENNVKFYGSVIPRIKRTIQKSKKSIEQNSTIKNKQQVVSDTQVQKTSNESEMSKEDYEKILNLLKSTSFSDMMQKLGVKQAVIIALRLGYIEGKYYSTESIADFLNIEKQEVIETTKNCLLLFQDSINSFIDEAIKLK